MRKVIVLVNAAPYGTATPAEAYRTIQGLAGMGVQTTCVLLGDGVFVLMKDQRPESIDMQNLSEAYKALSEFDVKIYVCRDSMEERGVKESDIEGADGILSCDEINKLIDEHHCVLTFTSGG